MRTLVADVEVEGRRADVEVADGSVVALHPVGSGSSRTSTLSRLDEVVDGRGGALLPGLHDHHLHVLALAAARESIDCGAGLAVLRTAPGQGWVRGTGYHESVAGPLDRHALDRLVPDRPVRLQHRSGALWMLNSPALAAVAHVLDDSGDVERDEAGEPTGRLWRYDARLRPALPRTEPDVAAVGCDLADLGITGVTEATPDLDDGAIALLRGLPQHLTLLGSRAGAALPAGMSAGPLKLLLPDHDLPTYDVLVGWILAARPRAVAVHCVTRASLVLTLAVLEEVGARPGDRIEHAAVCPPDVAAWMARLGVAVVTQPDFLRSRGAAYRRDVDAGDLPHLYPHAGLLAAGVRTAPSSDAPYGEVDPWRVIRTAAERDLGPEERVPARTALAGYLSSPDDPGGIPRRIAVGGPADLVLLHAPLAEALRAPDRSLVRATSLASGSGLRLRL